MTPAHHANDPRPRKIFLLLLAYFALQVVVRLNGSAIAEYDEAEQLVMSQKLLWGYGVQPPLYTWLQAGAFQLFGVNLFALAVLKNILLAGTFLCVYRAVKLMTGSVATALAAMVSLFFLPQIAWESQRDQTHSVLMTMLAAAMLLAFVQLAGKRRVLDYVVFGLLAGLGCLSKYNYAVFLVSLLLAAGWLNEFRPVLRTPRLVFSFAAFALVTAPHACWMWTHKAAVLSRANEVHFQNATSRWLGSLPALGSLISAVVGFSAIAVFLYVVLFWRAKPQVEETSEVRSHRRLLLGIVVAGLLICAAMALLAQAKFKDRWMQPLLFLTPALLAVWVHRKLDAMRLRWLLGLGSLVAVAVLGAIFFTPYWAVKGPHWRYLNPAYATLAKEIRAQGFTSGAILRDGHKLGGNLRLFFPDCPNLGGDDPQFTAPKTMPWLVVWLDSGTLASRNSLTNYLWAQRGVEFSALKPVRVELPYELVATNATVIDFAIIPPAQ